MHEARAVRKFRLRYRSAYRPTMPRQIAWRQRRPRRRPMRQQIATSRGVAAKTHSMAIHLAFQSYGNSAGCSQVTCRSASSDIDLLGELVGHRIGKGIEILEDDQEGVGSANH